MEVIAALLVGLIVGYMVTEWTSKDELRLYAEQIEELEDQLADYADELDEIEELNDRLVSSNVVIFNVVQDADEPLPLDFTQHTFEFEDGETIVRAEG